MNEFNLPQNMTSPQPNKKMRVLAVIILFVVLVAAVFIVKKVTTKKQMTKEDIFEAMRTSETSTLSKEDMAVLESSMASDGQNRITPAQLEELKESMKSQ